jgi:hypothetical protein
MFTAQAVTLDIQLPWRKCRRPADLHAAANSSILTDTIKIGVRRPGIIKRELSVGDIGPHENSDYF